MQKCALPNFDRLQNPTPMFGPSSVDCIGCSFAAYVQSLGPAPDNLQFPLVYPKSGAYDQMPFAQQRPLSRSTLPCPLSRSTSPPSSFVLIDVIDDDMMGDMIMDARVAFDPRKDERASKRQRADCGPLLKKLQFSLFYTIKDLIYPPDVQWEKLQRLRRADENGFTLRHYAKLRHQKKIKREATRNLATRKCTCKVNSACHYCAKMHSRVMIENHRRDPSQTA